MESKESSPQQRLGSIKGKRCQLQSPPVSNRTQGNQTPNLQSTPELATLEGEMGKDSLVEDEQPLALRGGGDSRINKRIRKKKLTNAEISRM